MTPSVRAQIDLGAIRHNLHEVKRLAPGRKVLAMIKANAYGHGLVAVARALSGQADALAVARADEALWLREAGIDCRLVVMGGAITRGDMEALLRAGIDLSLHSSEQLEMFLQASKHGDARLWLKFDSGMHRLGFDAAGLRQAMARLDAEPAVSERVVLTHFACADDDSSDATALQWQRFAAAAAGLNAQLSAANSGAILLHPETHADWIRPGIMLYGVSPVAGHFSEPGLLPAMSLRARLIAVRDVAVGESVGYGRTWTAARPSRIGTISIGYGDGYPRHARSGTPVLVGGMRVPLVGRVSMDMISVDLTDHPGASIGDDVELWGASLSVNEVAAWADTIGYELLTGISPRVRCEYQLQVPAAPAELASEALAPSTPA